RHFETRSKTARPLVAQACRPALGRGGSPEGLRYRHFETRSKTARPLVAQACRPANGRGGSPEGLRYRHLKRAPRQRGLSSRRPVGLPTAAEAALKGCATVILKRAPRQLATLYIERRLLSCGAPRGAGAGRTSGRDAEMAVGCLCRGRRGC